MVALAVQLENADRMMISATASEKGIALAFADGCEGLIPFSDLPDVGTLGNLKGMALSNPYEMLLKTQTGETIEIPWDFARPYCDDSYRERVELVGKRGRLAIGERIRQLRHAAQMTQEQLAAAADIGRVTLVRIENGEQSPRHETLLALAKAMNHEPGELLVSSH